jgi:hypothetical protein
MKVYLATAYPTPWSYLPRFRDLASRDRFGVHTLTDSADEADVILHVDARHEHGDWELKAIRQDALTRRHVEKSFIYNEMDQPWCALPGLYVSMPRTSFNPRRQRACSYTHHINPYVEQAASQVPDPDLLFSFMGRRCHAARVPILNLAHPRGLIEDTSNVSFFGTSGPAVEERKARYAQVLARSKFVLSPRGAGPASFRLFEALAAGRVPVIIGDEWVAPEGPDWASCSIRLRESELGALVGVVEAAEERYPQLAEAACEAYREWFAPEVLFHRMVEACLAIRRNRLLPEAVWQRLPDRRLMRLQARVLKARILSRRKTPGAQPG